MIRVVWVIGAMYILVCGSYLFRFRFIWKFYLLFWYYEWAVAGFMVSTRFVMFGVFLDWLWATGFALSGLRSYL